MLALNTIKPGIGRAKKRKRVGRGNAAGKGTYAGRGLKGQKSRAGVSNLKRLGMKQVLLRTPKKRGFKSSKPKAQIVNLSVINKYFKDKETINPKVLFAKGVIKNTEGDIKILGTGKLTVNGLIITGVGISESARRQIEKNKGQIMSPHKK